MSLIVAVCSVAVLAAPPAPAPGEYFQIEVIDALSGRGVPLVELRTVNAIRYYTDSNGVVAFREPGLMNRTVFFFIRSHGYEFPKDGFGMRGRALQVKPGGRVRLKLKRLNVAERLYRVTGAGIYRDSLLVGRPTPISHPVLNGSVLGQDSVFTVVYSGRLYWLWGDTSRPGYPLGNFHMSGATSRLPEAGGLDPAVGVNLNYFVDERGFSREMARMPGEGPTWLEGFTTLMDERGREQLFAAYAKVRPGSMEVHQRGLALFNDEKQHFEKLATLPMDAPVYPTYHTFKIKANGIEYVYFVNPYPLTRVRATPAQYCRLSAYEAFTCLGPGSRLDDPKIDRNEDGSVRYGWKRDTPAVGPAQQDKLVKAGKLAPHQALLQLREADTGKSVLAHRASVYYNAYRRRWVMIACEQFGTSLLGEIWFAEGDTPLGPWVYARKVVTHQKYSFYNPKHHPMFDQEKGRVIFFEGTYTHTFSGNPDRTPRYDYNQIMYRLDLADPRLVLPVPVYRVVDQDGSAAWGTAHQIGSKPGKRKVAFFALDRPKEGTVPVTAVMLATGEIALEVGETSRLPEAQQAKSLFYALPAGTEHPPATAVALFEYRSQDGRRREYSTDADQSRPDFSRSKHPLCFVWRNPMGATRQDAKTVNPSYPWEEPTGEATDKTGSARLCPPGHGAGHGRGCPSVPLQPRQISTAGRSRCAVAQTNQGWRDRLR
ncbi:MAG: hypothetical protein ACYSWU_02935 [Planctomycetota bacterium]|jgi:hypothetical protein